MSHLPRSRRHHASMILPPFERPTREFPRTLNYRDARIPRPFSYDQQAHLVGAWERTERCPDGRHLWDAAIAHGEVRHEEDGSEHAPFRLHLTCVRCGTIYRLAGLTDEDDCRFAGSIDPVPLQIGGLHAQQIENGGNLGISLWSIHSGEGTHIGDMSSGISVRGRRYIVGQVHGLPPLEGPNAHTCLRKLAKLQSGMPGHAGDVG